MILFLGTWKALQKLALSVEMASRIEFVSISAINLPIAIHLPNIWDDDGAFGYEVSVIEVVLDASMWSAHVIKRHFPPPVIGTARLTLQWGV